MMSWSLSTFYLKKHQILFQKTYQFINIVNGVSHSHKTANIFFHLNNFIRNRLLAKSKELVSDLDTGLTSVPYSSIGRQWPKWC